MSIPDSTQLDRFCCCCGEELFDSEKEYCEDCRESGDLEDVLEKALDASI